MKVLFYLVIGFLLPGTVVSQDQSNLKFGNISARDFVLPKNKIVDSSTNAVIIGDFGTASFIGNKKGWFTLVFKRYTRIMLLNEKSFELATIRIPLYSEKGDAEKLIELKGSTYNLENGKIVESKLEKTDLFEDKLDKNHTAKKFTMPAIKAGSIIEYDYTVNSDFLFNMRPWVFQHINYPCLWSEYNVTIPNLLIYVATNQGIHQFFIDKADKGEQLYSITEPSGNYYGDQTQYLHFKSPTNIHRYVMKDVPGFEVETYLTSPKNFVDKIELQLSKTSSDGETYTDAIDDWPKFSQELLQRDDFGAFLHEANVCSDEALNAITKNDSEKFQIAKGIYDFIRTNFTCLDDESFLMTKPLKDVFRTKSGNIADINLLLMALLMQKGILCDPVLLSTRPHGLNFFDYPLWSKYNYLICRTNIDGKTYYLDATHPRLGFGKLDPDCYNGRARVINGFAEKVNFDPDSLSESRTTLIYGRNDDKGNLTGSIRQVLGDVESYKLRNRINEEGQTEFWKNLKSDLPTEMEISNTEIDSLTRLEDKIGLTYEFTLALDKKDLLYFNPTFDNRFRQNPFKSEERAYPIELPYATDEMYLLTMEIPEGYVVDELPQQLSVKLNEKGDGIFEYLISRSGNVISLKLHIRLTRTIFKPEEYSQLREFFNLVVKKNNEQIVFKRKK